MNLHQLNLTFDAKQDRLLLKVSTTSEQEFRFWLTRRLVQRAWAPLVTKLQGDTPAPMTAAPLASAPLEFRHAAAVQQADFKTPYVAEGKTPAVSPDPLLVTQFSLQSLALDRYEMTLTSDTGLRVSVKLAAPVLHGLVKLLQDASRSADWSLSLALPAAAMASAAIN